jgi:hypothetical protein
MRSVGGWGMRTLAIAGVLAALGVPVTVRAAGEADSSLVWRWSAVYRSTLDIERTSWHFPWNDAEILSPLNDRLAALGELIWRDHIFFFAKGATGSWLGGDYQEQRFVLDQGHVGFDLLGGAVRGRLFERERVYRTDQRLLKLVSDESSVVHLGEGLALEVNAGAHATLNYVESALRYDAAVRGGLPSFQNPGSYFRVVRLEVFQRRLAHMGFTLSGLRTGWYRGDRITVGTDLGFTVRGVDFLAELARTQPGGWEELRDHRLFDLEWRAARLDRFGALFSDAEAFAAEIEGLCFGMSRLGSAGLVPGYRYYGWAYDTGPAGEGERALSEGYALAWWKPAKYDAIVSIDASSGTSYGRDFNRLIGSARARYRGGFELKESILCETGSRSSAAVSFVDDNALSRLVLTGRVDDLGDGNVFSYLAEGTFNLGSRIAAKSALFLYRSRTSLYNVGLEFRPRERFLFEAAIGSFSPSFEGLTLDREWDLYTFELRPSSKDRYVHVSARVWFGGGGTR